MAFKQNTACQNHDFDEHMPVCRRNRSSLGSTITDIEQLRGVLDRFMAPRQQLLTPIALRAIMRSPEKANLDTHFFLLEFVPTSNSVQLVSASIQPLGKLYPQHRNGYQQYAALMQYSQRFRQQYEAAGVDVAGTLLVQCRCPSVLGQANDVTPITIVRWLMDQTWAEPPLEPDWQEQLVARMNSRTWQPYSN